MVFSILNLCTQSKKTIMKQFICYDAGCDIFEVEPFNPKIVWHNNEFKGSYFECMQEKKIREEFAYGFSNCLPAAGNEDALMNYHY